MSGRSPTGQSTFPGSRFDENRAWTTAAIRTVRKPPVPQGEISCSYSVNNLVGYGKRRSGCRARGIQDMYRFGATEQNEILDEASIACHRLGADSRASRFEIGFVKTGNEAPK